MSQSDGLSHAQAIQAIWDITANLSRLLAWLVFWIAHLVLALVCVLLLWWFQVTPADVMQAVTGASKSTTAAVAGLVGVSVTGLVGTYLALARWVWKRTYVPWQTDRLLDGVQHG